MRKKVMIILGIILGIYIALLIFLFSFQEKLIFYPQKLSSDYQFDFKQNYEEINIKTKDNANLNGLLFKSENTKGLIFYLHGNAGSLASWGDVAKTYTTRNYDVFILDYRGYGKSTGHITSQKQLFEDNQLVYNELLKKYDENNVIILGYSIGSGLAAKLVSENNPKLLILQAPYYSLTDLIKHKLFFIPSFILKYKLETNEYIKKIKAPIVIFHGDKDEVIYYESSIKLKNEFKSKISLITLKNESHNGITDNTEYNIEIKRILK
jgi:hypothetical protein